MEEQVDKIQGLKGKGAINEAYYAGLGHSTDAMRELMGLENEQELTPRERRIQRIAYKEGFGKGVAAGMQFVLKGDPQVERMVGEQNQKLDEGVLKNG